MKSKAYNPVARITLVMSMALYLAALTQECYCTSQVCGGHWAGVSILALGAIGGIMSLAGLTWYANPLLWVAWSLLNKQPKKAMIFSFIATITSAGFMLFNEITDITPGRSAFITEYRIGYWLWLASMVTMAAGSVLVYLSGKFWGPKANVPLILKVDFNNRCGGGIKLPTKGATYRNGKKKIKLQHGLNAIIWDADIHDAKPDNLAVKALILYSTLEKSWIASFNYDDLKHESEREEPLIND